MGDFGPMHKIASNILFIAATALTLSACGNKDASLMNLKASQTGPDEFAILPTKPLQEPENYQSLPTPTPGGSNITDPTPLKDAVAALGGKPSRLDNSGIYRGESGIVTYATRNGANGNIRQVLAAEDAEWRDENRGRLLERLFNVNVYFNAYEAQELDQHRELERLRRLGVWTPSAPPEITN